MSARDYKLTCIGYTKYSELTYVPASSKDSCLGNGLAVEIMKSIPDQSELKTKSSSPHTFGPG